MTNANNSSGVNPVVVPSNQKLTWNGTNNKWVTIPVNTGGTCSTGGTITINPGTITTICTGAICTSTGQVSFDDIDLAVPVDDIEENSDGCSCKKCQEYFPYAEPNQDDGTLICYGCRMRW